MIDTTNAYQALREALGRLRALQRRYGTISALSPVWKAVDRISAD